VVVVHRKLRSVILQILNDLLVRRVRRLLLVLLVLVMLLVLVLLLLVLLLVLLASLRLAAMVRPLHVWIAVVLR
jgi:hypothetical protein